MPSQQRQVRVLLAASALALWAGPAAGARRLVPVEAPPASRPGPGQGRVEFVTDKRAYLDHGADGGLAAGQAVPLFRAGRPAGACTVEAAAPHGASCVGGRPRVGDTFRLGRPLRAAPPAPRALPAVVAPEALEADAQAIAGAVVAKVDFAGQADFGARRAVELTVGYASFAAGDDPRGDFRQERLEGTLRLPLGRTGLRFDAAFTALRWHPRPESTRFRPGQEAQFFLWEAELTRRDGDARTVAAVGRLWPWHTPGLSLLDGLQLGRRNQDRTLEWGGYAGLIPDALSLAPVTDAWAAGLYASLTQAGTKDHLLRLARQEVRLGVRHLPGEGTASEAEVLAQAWLGWASLGAGGRGVYLAGSSSLDRGYLDLRLQPGLALGAGFHLRYFGPALDQTESLLRDVSPSLQGGYHAAGDAHWDPLTWMGVGLYGDLHRDATSGWSGQLGGVELRLPRLLGDLGGLYLGAESAEGWIRTRTAYSQLLGHLGQRLRLLARVSVTGSDFTDPAVNPNTRELDGYLQLDGGVFSWLRLRARAMVRAPLVFGEESRSPAPGLVLDVDATGFF
jgi:hypothetical protein